MWVITGATGFIGSALVWELNQRGQKNLLISDFVSMDQRPGVLKGREFTDFINAGELAAALTSGKFRISGILHMGACSTTTETDEAYLQKNNVEYSQRMFEICTEQKIPFIYASSGATYGDGKLGFDDERDPSAYKPLNLYGWSKLKFDIWAAKQTKTPPHWHGLRFFNVYGPNEYHKGEMSSVVFKAFNQIRETGKLRLFKSHNPKYNDGEQLRDFVYVKDVTHWMAELIDKPETSNGIYNMGYGEARTWLDLARATFETMNKPMQIEWIDVPPNIRDQYQYFTEAKMTKWKTQGLSQPTWSLEAGVRDYVGNYLMKKDPYL